MSEQANLLLIERVNSRIRARCAQYGLSDYAGGVVRYVEQGLQPGGFLTAVLEDSLKEAAMQADDVNQTKLFEWACVMYNDVPMDARGSKEKVAKWIAHGGMRGLMEEAD
jgi:hypothetical protein